MPRALVGGDCVRRLLGSMGIILATQFVLGAQFLLDLSGNVIGLLIGFLGLIFGRDLIVSWYSDEAAGKIHRGELSSIGPKGHVRRAQSRGSALILARNDFAII